MSITNKNDFYQNNGVRVGKHVEIRGHVYYTQCTKNDALSEITGFKLSFVHSHFTDRLTRTDLYLKHEYKQFTGSFKERGARNALEKLTDEQKKKGVIAASAGNHALALSYHGGLMVSGQGSRTFMLRISAGDPCNGDHANDRGKEGRGNEMRLSAVQAKEHAMNSEEFQGMQYINGFDDPPICAGAGTIGLEILEQVPDVDVIVVPVGGAGLIAGIALAVKTLRPDVQVCLGLMLSALSPRRRHLTRRRSRV
eukprot:759529-Hanusia_phi.AAC.4